MDIPVIVVGAGPAGLLLAGELRLGGAGVVVLERLPEPTTESRASTLHARTMEILDSRGLVPALGDPPREPRGHFGGLPMDLTVDSAYPGQWKVPQTRLEQVLGEWATALGAEVRRGHELHDLAVHEDYVTAYVRGPQGSETVRARYVVACDGERSTVRKLTGVDFPGKDAGREMLRADVAGVTVPGRRFERLAGGMAVAARRPDGVTRVMVHEFGTAPAPRTAEPGFEEVVAAWKRVTGEDLSGGTPLWINAFGDASRQVAHYRQGRILYAGDAAHIQLPVGGQALNLALQDVVNLGWKLALRVRDRAPDSLLDTYHAERHEAGRRVLANIRAQTQLLLGGPEVDPLRMLTAGLLALPAARAHLAATISAVDVRYDVGDPDLGARLSLPAITAELLRDGQGLLLTERPTDADVAAPWIDRVRLAPGPALLVRPDGHVVWSRKGGGDLSAALHRWFGPPAPDMRGSG